MFSANTIFVKGTTGNRKILLQREETDRGTGRENWLDWRDTDREKLKFDPEMLGTRLETAQR